MHQKCGKDYLDYITHTHTHISLSLSVYIQMPQPYLPHPSSLTYMRGLGFRVQERVRSGVVDECEGEKEIQLGYLLTN
jgi:hypothetical protein